MILADVEASYTPIYPSRLATSPSCVLSCAAYPAHGRSNSQEDCPTRNALHKAHRAPNEDLAVFVLSAPKFHLHLVSRHPAKSTKSSRDLNHHLHPKRDPSPN